MPVISLCVQELRNAVVQTMVCVLEQASAAVQRTGWARCVTSPVSMGHLSMAFVCVTSHASMVLDVIWNVQDTGCVHHLMELVFVTSTMATTESTVEIQHAPGGLTSAVAMVTVTRQPGSACVTLVTVVWHVKIWTVREILTAMEWRLNA